MADIAFLLTRSDTPPDPTLVVEHAAAFDIPLEINSDSSPEGATELTSFGCTNGRPGIMVCTFLPVPHPDAASMAVGPLSPTADAIAAARSHMILVGFGIEGTTAERDAVMYLFTAAVAQATDAVAAMLGPADNFHRADAFIDLVSQIPNDGVPPELQVRETRG